MAEKIYLLNKATMREMKKCTGALTYKQQAIQVRAHFRIFVRTCVYIYVICDGFCVFFLFLLIPMLDYHSQYFTYFK